MAIIILPVSPERPDADPGGELMEEKIVCIAPVLSTESIPVFPWGVDNPPRSAYDGVMRKLHDRFFKQAKREGKLARSVYKLEELDRRDHLFRKGDAVLDLGASPGSWLEYIIGAIGPEGKACAVDLKPIHKKFKGLAHFRLCDVRDLTGAEFAGVAERFDAIVSDMAPNTSGIRIVDQAKSQELCECVVALAERLLKKGGNLVMKIFYGPDTEAFRAGLADRFQTVKLRKPDACRDESIESYIIGLGFGNARVENTKDKA